MGVKRKYDHLKDQMLDMHYKQGMTFHAIGLKLNIPITTVRRYIQVYYRTPESAFEETFTQMADESFKEYKCKTKKLIPMIILFLSLTLIAMLGMLYVILLSMI